MKIGNFIDKFERSLSGKIYESTWYYDFPFLGNFFDYCPNVKGLISIKKQRLLNIAYGCLEQDECYLEVGTYCGKGVISAMINNNLKKSFVCDNFSDEIEAKFLKNIKRYTIEDYIVLYKCNFLEIYNKEKLPVPIGLYFYDAAHDEKNQYLAIKKVEPFLSKRALVIIDDWRFAEDSQSYAKAGTERAISESNNKWQLLYDLPARFNGDKKMWWNGVAVFKFNREDVFSP